MPIQKIASLQSVQKAEKQNFNRSVNSNVNFQGNAPLAKSLASNSLSQASKAIFQSTINKSPKVYSVSFTGNHNKNQVVMLSAEIKPYSDIGGMGAIVKDVPDLMMKKYEAKGLDFRRMVPFYNSEGQVKEVDGELWYVKKGPDGKDPELTPKTMDKNWFKVEDTGIKTEFKNGVEKSTAELYKFKDNTGAQTYIVRTPEISRAGKAYDRTYNDMWNLHADFSAASLALLEKTAENKNEQFDPKIVNTTDWHTAFAVDSIYQANNNDKDDYVDGIKTIHTIHNIGPIYQGMTDPFHAAINSFSEQDVDKLINDIKGKKKLTEVILDFAEKSDKAKEDATLKDKLISGLDYVADNYDELKKDKQNNLFFKYMNSRIPKIFPEKNWIKHGNKAIYNPSAEAIEKCDKWHTVSGGFYQEMKTLKEMSGDMQPVLAANAKKGDFVLNRLDTKNFWNPTSLRTGGPNNNGSLRYPFSINSDEVGKEVSLQVKDKKGNVVDTIIRKILDYKSGKAKNKEFVQELLSSENEKTKDAQYGHLNVDSKAPLAVLISRPDKGQKGTHILMNAAKEFLKTNEDMQLVIGGPDYNVKEDYVSDFLKDVINNKEFEGRVVFYAQGLPTKEFTAGADMVLMPSRFEPCGLVQQEGMSMGAVTIGSNTGGIMDTVDDPETNTDEVKKLFKEGKEKGVHTGQTGFKTKDGLMFAENPEQELVETVNRAYDVYKNDTEKWDQIVQNCLKEDLSWDTSLEKYYTKIFDQGKTSKRVKTN